jgi:hypothetical protein
MSGSVLGQYNDNDDVVVKGSSKFRTIFAAPAQVITGASYVSVYSYSGSGLFYGITIKANQDGFQLRVLVDGTDILVTDISGSQLNTAGLTAGIMYRTSAGVLHFYPPSGVPYTSSIQILGKRDNAGSVTVDSYLAHHSKET